MLTTAANVKVGDRLVHVRNTHTVTAIKTSVTGQLVIEAYPNIHVLGPDEEVELDIPVANPHPGLDAQSDRVFACKRANICPECGAENVKVSDWSLKCDDCTDDLADLVAEIYG